MKALTLTQPWATLVITGRKHFETRGWRTDYRGPLAIHAAKGMPGWAKDAAREFGLDPELLPRGAVLGIVQLVGMEPTLVVRPALDREEREMGDYDDGRWAWRLVQPRAYPEPVAATGALGLWDWPVAS